ncbi:PilZ domain-containing protein [Noviherbaspirillum malthae]|uniref:PilZ domain-containing protein n=1 Tax=Noviherbaspirillum malthae TaxID=1260987 RepID=UPI00188EA68E|nr:PilZ domain-containing protein [Noviherbaspirillum malthae]
MSQRRHFSFDTKVLMDDIGPYSVITVNVSRHGLGLLSHRLLDIGRNYAIAIAVPDSPRRINAWGTVVYCDSTPDGFQAGVRFLDMDAYSRACIDDLLTSHEGVR